MVDINANASQLQAQLQAQTRGNRDATALARGAGGVKPNAAALADEKIRDRQDQQAGQNRQLPVKIDDRVANLSSSEELKVARARVDAATGNTNREAPAGRTSERQNALRNQPLGQIIDIRV